MGAAMAYAVADETERYAVSIWMIGSDEPVVQYVRTPGAAAEIVLWMRGDPATTRIVVTDTKTGRNLSIWMR